jgi:hypothetical protein
MPPLKHALSLEVLPPNIQVQYPLPTGNRPRRNAFPVIRRMIFYLTAAL